MARSAPRCMASTPPINAGSTRPARSRRHREQEAARRQRHSRRVARHRQGRCIVARAAALPLCRRGGGDAAAGADDEHHQWRGACRQSDRLPGIHDRAGRRASIAEAVRMGAEVLHALKTRAERRGPQHQCRRRGRLCAQPRLGAASARFRHGGHRRRRLQARRGHLSRARSGGDGVLRRGPLLPQGREAQPRPRTN